MTRSNQRNTDEKPSLRIRLAAWLLVTVAAIALLEGLSRLVLAHADAVAAMPGAAAIMGLDAMLDPYEQPAPNGSFHWKLRPGYARDARGVIADKRSQGKTLGAEAFASDARSSDGIRINSDGYRGPERASETNAVRILMLGDSVTFGLANTTYPDVVRDALGSAGLSVDVVNAGVEGYFIRNHVLELDRYLALRPDIVTLYVGWNDLFGRDPIGQRPFRFLELVDLIAANITRRLARSVSDSEFRATPEAANPNSADVRSIGSHVPDFVPKLFELADRFSAAGATVYVMTLPGLFVSEETPSARALALGHLPFFTRNPYVLARLTENANAAIRRASASERIRVIDLERWSRTALSPRDEFFLDSVHLNGEALLMIGQYIASRLKNDLRRDN